MKQHARNRVSGAVFWLLGVALISGAVTTAAVSQSTDQSFPTAVTGNELTGTIRARDIGDARITSYYFTFNANQGDLFVNIVTKNLNGAVNLFAADGLRPLGQVLVYADLAASETGRVIYFRKPEKVILRIEGRTPNDDPAEFQIKFAGSFEAAVPTDAPEAPKVSRAALETDSGVKVNSVGTIIAVVPKPKLSPAEPSAKSETEKSVATSGDEPAAETKPLEARPNDNTDAKTPIEDKKVAEETRSDADSTSKAEAQRAETKAKTPASKASAVTRRPTRRPRTVAPSEMRKTDDAQAAKADTDKGAPDTNEPKSEPTDSASSEPKTSSSAPRRKPKVVVTENLPPPKADPMAGMSLVILFKDGTRIDRPMNEVTRFSVDRGVLTVVNKDGTTAKYSILDVTSLTVENP